MRRVARRFYNLTALGIVCYVVYTYLPSPPNWENDHSHYHTSPSHEQSAEPDFLYFSRFRPQPDEVLEARIDEALVLVENRELHQNTKIIKKIWQTGPPSEAARLQISSQWPGRGDSSALWVEQNPEWEYHYVNDYEASQFISTTLASIPCLLDVWKSYPLPVLRSDLFRYIALWYHGGYYCDLDVYPTYPITSCPSLANIFVAEPPRTISLVLGLEIDEPYASPRMREEWHWSRTYGFAQYNFYAPRRFSPFLRRAIVRAIAHSVKHNGVTAGMIYGPRYTENDILEVTGPGMFTDAIVDKLSEYLPSQHELIRISAEVSPQTPQPQRRLTWAPFHRLQQPMWINISDNSNSGSPHDLLVLPINVWGNGQRHSGSDMFNHTEACANHLFGRSSKKGWWEYLLG